MLTDEYNRYWICVWFNIWLFNLSTHWLIHSALKAAFQTCNFELESDELNKWNVFLDLLSSDSWIVTANRTAGDDCNDVE